MGNDSLVMISEPLEVRVWPFSITEMPTQVEKKSEQTDLKDTPEQMSLPINDLPEAEEIISFVLAN